MAYADPSQPDAHEPRRYYGKYAGLVTDSGPPEGGKAHRGEIKVKVPGILEETPDGSGHQPIEVLAAPAFLPGFFYVPEEQARVWVEFVDGNINFPIWSGAWYPDDAPPKAVDASKPTAAGSGPTRDQKVIRTKSGQVIQLEDTDGGEQLVIKDEKNGNAITLSSKGITIGATASGGNVTLLFGGDSPTATVVVEDKKITLTAGDAGSGSSITLDASAGVTIRTSGVTVTIDTSKMDVS